MSANVLLTLFGMLYVASVAVGALLSLHTARSWHAAFWCNRTLSRFANWHPVAADAGFKNGVPTHAPTDSDLKALLGFAIIPLVNTAIVVYVLLACPVITAIQQLTGQDESATA